MFSRTMPRRMSALITAACLVPLLIAGFMTSAPAYADGPPPPNPDRIIICRTDPIVFLSDGTKVKMTAEIGTAVRTHASLFMRVPAP